LHEVPFILSPSLSRHKHIYVRLTSRLNAQVSFEEISAWLLNCQVLLKYHLAIPLDHESTQLSRLVNITRIKFSNV